MTKREFDKATKLNYGAHYHSATRYRREVRLRGADLPNDYVWMRYCEMSWRNAYGGGRDGFLPTLAIGSRFRAPQAYRAKTGRPLLEAR